MKKRIIQTIKTVFPGAKIDPFTPYWGEAIEYAQISTNAQAALFIAHTGHESKGFTRFVESFAYSAERLAVVWPRLFATVEESIGPNGKKVKKYLPNAKARLLAGRPVDIASHAYADRGGNGPATTGDGWRYRGRGLIQLTFRRNYERFNEDLGPRFSVDFVKNPELVEEPRFSLWSGAWYWRVNRLNQYADRHDVEGSTRVINGGLNGLDERLKFFNKALKTIRAL